MSTAQVFTLMMAIYIAPNLTPTTRTVAGMLCGVAATGIYIFESNFK